MIMRHAAVLCAALASVSFGHAANAAEARYRCKDGSSIVATFTNVAGGAGAVALAFGAGEHINLPQVLSADGGRYADKDIEFWIKGNGATLTRGGKSTTCTTR